MYNLFQNDYPDDPWTLSCLILHIFSHGQVSSRHMILVHEISKIWQIFFDGVFQNFVHIYIYVKY